MYTTTPDKLDSVFRDSVSSIADVRADSLGVGPDLGMLVAVVIWASHPVLQCGVH